MFQDNLFAGFYFFYQQRDLLGRVILFVRD